MPHGADSEADLFKNWSLGGFAQFSGTQSRCHLMTSRQEGHYYLFVRGPEESPG